MTRYEKGEICPSDYRYECEQSYFSMVDEENFLDSIKVEVKYYTKNGLMSSFRTLFFTHFIFPYLNLFQFLYL